MESDKSHQENFAKKHRLGQQKPAQNGSIPCLELEKLGVLPNGLINDDLTDEKSSKISTPEINELIAEDLEDLNI